MNLSDFHSAEFQKFVQDHLDEDPALLLLKYQGKVSIDLKEAVQQISARKKAAKKLPEWVSNPQIIFPVSISLEQSSSEDTAKLKSKNRSGKLMIDLTGGFGVDSFYLGQNFEKAIYCEQNEDLAKIAKYNLDLLSSGKFEIVQGDGLLFLEKSTHHFDLIYADPARRGTGNQKLYKLKDCQPDVVSAWELMKSKADKILLKLSPMLDISQALSELSEIQKITIVSVKNEVKEVLLSWEKGKETTNRKIQVHDLGRDFQVFEFEEKEEEHAESTLGEVGKYLVEPLSGILKAGAFRLFGKRFGLKKLEKSSHLYTANEITDEIPGRVFEVLKEIKNPKKELKAILPDGKVNVITRNYILKADELKKKFGLKDGGHDYLIGTKTESGYKVFWCKRTQ